MNNAERHLIDTIEDLKSRIKKGTQYDLIRASGLLRQLLIDSPSLIDKANESHKKKIIFKVNKPYKKDSGPHYQDGVKWEPVITVAFIDPGEDTTYAVDYKKSMFLGYPVFEFSGHTFTIKDVIKISANVLGGVHYGKAATTKDELLLIANEMIKNIDGTSNCASAIKNIGNVTIKAIDELKEGIEKIV